MTLPPPRGADAPDPAGARILFVCTANRCRSPMAEVLARRRIGKERMVVASAGLLPGGLPTPRNGIEVAGDAGLDLATHRSRQLHPAELPRWDVVLSMTREQTRELVALDPGLWPRVFTLPQFARWIDAHPPGRHADLRGWIELAAADRSRSEMIGSSSADDVEDPVDGPRRAWRRLIDRLERDLDTIADRLIPADARGVAGAQTPIQSATR